MPLLRLQPAPMACVTSPNSITATLQTCLMWSPIGDVVKVKVINVDPTGRIKLSRKALLEPSDGDDGSKGDQGGSDDKGGGSRRRRDGRKPAEAS